MRVKTLLAVTTGRLLLAVVIALCSGATMGQTASTRFVRIAELQIDPSQLDAFAAATREIGQASVNLEEGCIALYAVADKDNPAFVRVFEVYRDPAAYQAHLQTPHFKKFRDTTNAMVTSRKLMARRRFLSPPSPGRRHETRFGADIAFGDGADSSMKPCGRRCGSARR